MQPKPAFTVVAALVLTQSGSIVSALVPVQHATSNSDRSRTLVTSTTYEPEARSTPAPALTTTFCDPDKAIFIGTVASTVVKDDSGKKWTYTAYQDPYLYSLIDERTNIWQKYSATSSIYACTTCGWKPSNTLSVTVGAYGWSNSFPSTILDSIINRRL